MPSFKHKPRYASRPWEWLITGGRAHNASAARFIRELSDYVGAYVGVDDVSDQTILISFRDAFRRMQEADLVKGLTPALSNSNPLIRSVAIWLISYSANRCELLGIDEHRYDTSPMVRKHVAKALRRLEAWRLLESMADSHPQDRAVRWFATRPPTGHPFDRRLANFSTRVDDSNAVLAAGPSRMPLWFRDEYWSGKPPKSVEVIRAILRRIRFWVHGAS